MISSFWVIFFDSFFHFLDFEFRNREVGLQNIGVFYVIHLLYSMAGWIGLCFDKYSAKASASCLLFFAYLLVRSFTEEFDCCGFLISSRFSVGAVKDSS